MGNKRYLTSGQESRPTKELNTLERPRNIIINKSNFIIIFGALLILMSIASVLSSPKFEKPLGTPDSDTTSYLIEDSGIFSYNFSDNVSNNVLPTQYPWTYTLMQINSSYFLNEHDPIFYNAWFNLSSLTGILNINSTNDSMCGRYNVSVLVSDGTRGDQELFYFIINATNDFPNFTYINNSYNMTQNQSYITYVNASDEEKHYPLYFNASFISCTTLLPRNNCTLFSFVNSSNNSAMINITPTKNDVGTYTANISVMDYGEHFNSSAYPYQTNDYSQNKTTYYYQLINFTVFAALDINYSDCENKIFQQNRSGSCIINITTKDENDIFNVTSNATLRNYPLGNGYIFNKTWFFSYNKSAAVNYSYGYLINVTPQATEVGNWTINFSLYDINFSQILYAPIHVYVNKTINYLPIIQNISNQTAALNIITSIPITVWDNDLLIPDKNETGGGYNETLNFTAMILNQSNLNQIVTINGQNNLSVTPFLFPGTNFTNAIMIFTPNLTSGGNYTINFSAKDKKGEINQILFNLSIQANSPPNWTSPINTSMWEGNNSQINFSSYVTDYDHDSINFTYTDDGTFPSFILNRTSGIANFTPDDSDVGQHLWTVYANDQYFSVPYTFNITIYNIPDSPVIIRPISVSGPGNSVDSTNSNITAVELSLTTISIYVEDNDLKIPDPQKSFYYENLTINYTVNGTNNSMVTFVKNLSTPVIGSNRTQFYAIFTPRRNDNGTYVIFVNISDKTNRSDSIRFNMSVNLINPLPTLENITNITTAVTRNIYYRFNATDAYDGNSMDNGNNKFTFSYYFLNGTDFINNNQSIFNPTTGILNYTFNSTQGGIYKLNITVSNSQIQNDSKILWIYVYDYPVINFPLMDNQYNFFENNNYNLTFRSNHTLSNNVFGVNDNLTYLVYMDYFNNTKYLVYNSTNYFGNDTNLTFILTTNFSQETDGIKNLTIVVYPSTRNLENQIGINTTAYWNLTINHTNSPLTFSGSIGGTNKSIYGGSPQQVILSDYFNDFDALDPLHNQTIQFGYSSTGTVGLISVSIIDWINGKTPVITFSTESYGKANFTITGYEMNESNSSESISNITSNMFSVEVFHTQDPVPQPSSGGSSGSSSSGTTPYAFKIIVPSKISGYLNQKIIVPLRLTNGGKETFKNINLSAFGIRNGINKNAMKVSFDKSFVNSLGPGESQNITMTLIFNTNESGEYEVTVNATSKSPSYTDWSKIFVDLQQMNESDAKKFILFTEEFIVQNPSCLELKERMNEADLLMAKGDYSSARAIAENVLNSCKSYVEQASIPSKEFDTNYTILLYLTIAILISLILGVGYYFLKRRNYSKNPTNVKPFESN